MAKKNLQLSEIKVKSFVTLVEQNEQKTAKGGYVYASTLEAIISEVRPTWTEMKTRVSSEGDIIKIGGGR